MTAEGLPLLSIITTSYSASRLAEILRLLESIESQTYQHTETIVIVDGSVRLYNEVRHYVDINGIPRIFVYLNQSNPGANASRNLGILHANGSLVAVVDDDVVLSPQWAEEMVNTFRDDTIVGVTGPALPLWQDESMSWFPDEFSWLWGGTQWKDWGNKVIDVRNVGGMNCCFRRDALQEAGLYLTSLKTLREGGWFQPTGEEVELSLRIKRVTKKRIVFNPRAKVYHMVYKAKFHWPTIAKRAFRMGYLLCMTRQAHLIVDIQPSPSVEVDLLQRVFSRLLPRILKDLFDDPDIACRKFLVTFISLFFTSLGYLLYFARPIRRLK